MSDVAIKVEGLSKLYQLGKNKNGSLRESLASTWNQLTGRKSASAEDFWALEDVSFQIKRGEAVGIIGKNGAGKSTLLKVLSRITEPTKGRIEIDGRVASLLEVGTGFHPELSGRENVFLNGTILGMTRREIKAKFDDIVDFSGVEKFIDTPVKYYSSGMYVRLAFSVAAYLEPEILIIDEVLAVGDAEFQKKCLGKMSEVTGQGRTVLFVSHSMAAVNTFCTHGILLQKGRLAYEGPIRQAVERYILSSRHTAAEKTWETPAEAPGNDTARIMAVRVLYNEEVCSSIPISDEFCVEIEFVNLKPQTKLSVGLQLYDKSDVGVLASVNWASASLHADPLSAAAYAAGRYKSRCCIPGNLLNEGNFYINAVLLSDVSSVVAVATEAVSFEIVEDGEMRKEYAGGWLGVVRPKLDWYTAPLVHSDILFQ
jgi:lipopolysaccharide transport system ATP-binding protein